ncbi:hypothetical protein [Devosia sp. 2618]|uniref:hypothetical protein n=1 Tax=Devosia sp. 2618 TaxID=3156454 RepID=UPI003395B554
MHTTNRQRRTFVRNSLILVAVAAVAVLLGVPAKAFEMQQLYPDDDGQTAFVTPSGNIGCIYTPEGGTSTYSTLNALAEIQCDRVEPNYVRAILSSEGKGIIERNVGDAGCCSLDQQLGYGHVVQLGSFQCLSERRGLSCAREDGHGFFLSRALVEAK